MQCSFSSFISQQAVGYSLTPKAAPLPPPVPAGNVSVHPSFFEMSLFASGAGSPKDHFLNSYALTLANLLKAQVRAWVYESEKIV